MTDLRIPASQVEVNPTDPISARIAAYLSDLSRLESEFTVAREALHTEFKADVKAMVHNGNWQVYPNITPGGSEFARALNQQVKIIVEKQLGRSR